MIFIFLIVILLGLVFQKSKFITAIQLVICVVIFSFNTESPDYSGYLGTYNSALIGGEYKQYFNAYGFFYRLICVCFNEIGLSFNQFRFVLFIVCMALIIHSINKITNRRNLVLSLYMIYPFIMDCIQIRNFIAEAIVIFSIPYLLDANRTDKGKENIIKFSICVFVATLFHKMSILYFVYTALFFKGKFKTIYWIELSGLLLITIIISNGWIPNVDFTGYFATRVSNVTMVFLSGITYGLVAVTCYYMKKKKDISRNNYINDNNVRFFMVNTTVFIPLFIFHFDMFRFARNVMIIFSAIAGKYLDRIQEKYKKKSILTLSSIGIRFVFLAAYSLLLWRSAIYDYDISLIDEVFNSVRLSW